MEEQLCMRYAEKVTITGFSVAHGFDFNDSRFPYVHAFKVRKRVDPGSITGITGASSTNNDGSATPSFTGIAGVAGADAARFYANYGAQRPNLEHHWLNGIVVVSAEL
jgi:hypothetical protein